MPTFKPGGTLPVVLPCDSNETNPLTFIVSALSVNQANELGQTLDSLLETPMKDSERTERLFTAVSPLVSGWRNTDVPYSWSALCDVMSMDDIWSLAFAIRRQLGYSEKKA